MAETAPLPGGYKYTVPFGLAKRYQRAPGRSSLTVERMVCALVGFCAP